MNLQNQDPIARKIRLMRKGEQAQRGALLSQKGHYEEDFPGYYNDERNLREYKERLQGIRNFLVHVKKTESNVVLDLGAGETKAISEMRDENKESGLEFVATNLTRNPKIEKKLGFEKTFITSAERLRGIKDNSVGGITSVFSLPYADVELSLSSIDRVLVEGGILKAQFSSLDSANNKTFKEKGKDFKSYIPYYQKLKEMSYDVEIKTNEQTLTCVLVAIKPGKFTEGEAKKVLEEDYKEHQQTQKS